MFFLAMTNASGLAGRLIFFSQAYQQRASRLRINSIFAILEFCISQATYQVKAPGGFWLLGYTSHLSNSCDKTSTHKAERGSNGVYLEAH